MRVCSAVNVHTCDRGQYDDCCCLVLGGLVPAVARRDIIFVVSMSWVYVDAGWSNRHRYATAGRRVQTRSILSPSPPRHHHCCAYSYIIPRIVVTPFCVQLRRRKLTRWPEEHSGRFTVTELHPASGAEEDADQPGGRGNSIDCCPCDKNVNRIFPALDCTHRVAEIRQAHDLAQNNFCKSLYGFRICSQLRSES